MRHCHPDPARSEGKDLLFGRRATLPYGNQHHNTHGHSRAEFNVMTGNIELIHQLYENFNARKIDDVLAKLADNVVWANGMHGGHVEGREAVRAYWTAQWSTIDPHVEPEQIAEKGGEVVVDVHQTVRDLEGKLLLDETVHHVFQISDGKVTRFDIRSVSKLSSVLPAS
jgi:ketosteroid isomerase-like protein